MSGATVEEAALMSRSADSLSSIIDLTKVSD